MRSARWSGLLYALPVVIVVGLIAVTVGAVVFLGSEGRDRDRELINRATPARCAAPSSCTGRTTSGGDTFAFCGPPSANRYRAGDIVFIETSSRSSRAATFVGTSGSVRARVESSNGVAQTVDLAEIRGAYCMP